MTYYVFVQILAGIFQSTGWPSVVSVMGNWFGKSKRGLIMGVWNAHTSAGLHVHNHSKPLKTPHATSCVLSCICY